MLLRQEFTAARYIRLRLQRIRTLNADLMMAIEEDPRYLDPTVTNRVSQCSAVMSNRSLVCLERWQTAITASYYFSLQSNIKRL